MLDENFEKMPLNLLLEMLTMAGGSQYLARFKQLNKKMNEKLAEPRNLDEAPSYFKQYWKDIYQSEYLCTTEFQSSRNYKESYRQILEKYRPKKGLIPKPLILLRLIHSNDLPTIRNYQWNAEDFLHLSIDKSTPIVLANSKKRLGILKYFYQEAERQIFSKIDGNNITDSYGISKFEWGAHCGEPAAFLTGTGEINNNISNPELYLFIALLHGHLDVVRILIKKIDINVAINDENQSPLYVAALHGHIDIVCLLIEQGAMIHNGGKISSSPLKVAVEKSHYHIAKLLLEAGANVEGNANDEDTPLTIAVANQNLKLINLLIDYKADVNKSGTLGGTPLTISCQNGNKAIIELLIKKGASITCVAKNSWTALSVAINKNDLDMVNFLLEKGAYEGVDLLKEPINKAKKRGCNEIVSFLQMWDYKVKNRNINKLEFLIGFLQLPTPIKSNMSLSRANYSQKIMVKQLKEFETFDSQKITAVLNYNKDVIPKDKFAFISKYIFFIDESEEPTPKRARFC